jgi:hypothetical protein
MIVILPTLLMQPLPPSTAIDNTLPLGQDPQGNIVIMTQKPWKPIRVNFKLYSHFIIGTRHDNRSLPKRGY